MKNKRYFALRSTKAVKIARDLMALLPPKIKSLMDVLKIYKWETLKKFLEYKSYSHRQVMVYGIPFSVYVDAYGNIALIKKMKDDRELARICDELKRYNVNCSPNNKGYIRIGYLELIKDDKVRGELIKILCERLKEYEELGIFEKTRQGIRRALHKLAPTEGAAAAYSYI